MAADVSSKRDHDGEGAAALAAGLYLVATPIGAAADVTLRALDILRRADAIAAEDTRRAGRLLEITGVPRAGRPLIPYHDHNGAQARPALLARIRAGEAVALVSDAGTPLVADPGWRLARAAIDEGLTVIAAPGASAVLAALSVAGLPTDRFLFAGFPPGKGGERARFLAEVAAVPATLVFYESPKRLAASLADMAATLGDRPAAICRELTKLHEEVRRDRLTALAAALDGEPDPKGEIVVVVGPPEASGPAGEDEIDAALRDAMTRASVRDAAREVSEALGAPRKAVYQRALALRAAERG